MTDYFRSDLAETKCFYILESQIFNKFLLTVVVCHTANKSVKGQLVCNQF